MTTRWQASDIAYCGNVHPSSKLNDITNNISHYMGEVRRRLELAQMGCGLWIPNSALKTLSASADQSEEIRACLNQAGLDRVTLNGFPYGDFHSARVKEQVYVPDWSHPERLHYTLRLCHEFTRLMGNCQQTGSVSTLPLGYKAHWSKAAEELAKRQLCQLADELAKLQTATTKKIVLCLEMEPDCVLESTDELLVFFADLLLSAEQLGYSRSIISEHIGICFDVCHQAVMHENIKQSLYRIHQQGIHIGKIQISNALRIPAGSLRESDSLQQLIDERYLHQMKGALAGAPLKTEADLDAQSIAQLIASEAEWRIHYHVPIHLQEFQLGKLCLATTQQCILETLDFLCEVPAVHPDIEVETYTLPVILEAQQDADPHQTLLSILAAEMQWLLSAMQSRQLLNSSALEASSYDK